MLKNQGQKYFFEPQGGVENSNIPLISMTRYDVTTLSQYGFVSDINFL